MKPIKMRAVATLAIFSFTVTGACAQSKKEKNQAGIQQADPLRQ